MVIGFTSLAISVEDLTDCGSVEVTQNNQRLIPGSFVLSSQVQNGRPVYQHTSLNQYVYFYQDADCAFWAVGPEVGQKSGIMYVYDTSSTPDKISGTFTSYVDQAWAVDSANSIKVKCLSST